MPRYTSADGLSLHYTDEGQGLPLLCLAGLTRTGHDFDYLAPHLSGVRLIRPDYRGRGASDRSPDPMTYTVAQEAADTLALLDHLALPAAAILGTSRGGLIALTLAAVAKPRLLGIAFNDIGPEIARPGLERIFTYIGRNPSAATWEEAAAAMPRFNPGVSDVPPGRWLDEARKHYDETPDGLRITYDPALRESFLAGYDAPLPDLWPLFDACAGLPLALIRGANSDLLTPETAAEMRRRRPDMVFADVPGRAHVPFLDEPQALAALDAWLSAIDPRARAIA